MKTIQTFIFNIVTFAFGVLLLNGCAGTAPEKDFVVYDRLAYPGKPDLTADGLSPIKLIYEASLLTEGMIDTSKINARIAEANEAGIKAVSTDIESWYWGGKYTTEMFKDSLNKVFEAFRNGIEGVSVGNYGVPIGSLNIARNVEHNIGKTDAEILAKLKSANNRLAAGEVSDVLYPSFYIYNPDVEQWIDDLKTTVAYIKEYYPDKKIVGYIWSQYYDWKTNPYYMQFISEDKFLQMLEAAYEHLDGVVLWAHGRDTDNKTKVPWEDGRVQGIYRAIKTFMRRHNLSKREMWTKYLEVPKEYGFSPKTRSLKSYSFADFDAEFLLQKNGPDTWQRVLKVFPKGCTGPVPAVVVPYYFPEAMVGFDLDSCDSLPKYASLEIMAHLAARGFASISAESYHLTYLGGDKDRGDFTRWKDAGDAISKDWPQWCGMGKLVADTRLLVDLLEDDDRIDADRIGIAGHSLGGKMAFCTGCVDPRIKAILASDFGFLWEQTNWEKSWYWGDKLDILKQNGITNVDLLSYSGGKPFFLIAGDADTDASFEAMKRAEGYEGHPERLGFLNHATGHRPPVFALEKGYEFLERYLK